MVMVSKDKVMKKTFGRRSIIQGKKTISKLRFEGRRIIIREKAGKEMEILSIACINLDDKFGARILD